MEKNVLYNGAIRLLKSIKFFTTLNKDKDSMATFVPEPEGTLEITENATGIDVKEAAYVNVNVEATVDPIIPTIAVSDNGQITVSGSNITTTSHTLSSEDDADFVASNIVKGVSIFGLTGTAEGASSFSAIPIEVKTSKTEYTLDGTTITPTNYGSFSFPLMGNGLYWFNYVSGGEGTSTVYRFLVVKNVQSGYSAFKTRSNNKTEIAAVNGATLTDGGNYLYFIGANTLPFWNATYTGIYIPLSNLSGQTGV